MTRVSGITIILLTALCVGVHAGELQTFTGVTCVEKPSNDGDSFTVKIPGKKKEYMGRVYCFVSTSAGNDLASMLTAGGFARVKGVGRKTPGGVSREETVQRLRDLETAASMKRCGIWEKSDPDRIVALRAEQRREEEELAKLKKEAAGKVSGEDGPPGEVTRIDVNKASREELETIKGIGPVLAGRIIQARPFKSVDELVRVKGIGEKSLGKMKAYMTISPIEERRPDQNRGSDREPSE